MQHCLRKIGAAVGVFAARYDITRFSAYLDTAGGGARFPGELSVSVRDALLARFRAAFLALFFSSPVILRARGTSAAVGAAKFSSIPSSSSMLYAHTWLGIQRSLPAAICQCPVADTRCTATPGGRSRCTSVQRPASSAQCARASARARVRGGLASHCAARAQCGNSSGDPSPFRRVCPSSL